MRVAKVTIELDDGETLIAEGDAVTAFNIIRDYEIAPVKDDSGFPQQLGHTGFRRFSIKLEASCRYFVAPGDDQSQKSIK